jgi:hypothetical protein
MWQEHLIVRLDARSKMDHLAITAAMRFTHHQPVEWPRHLLLCKST